MKVDSAPETRNLYDKRNQLLQETFENGLKNMIDSLDLHLRNANATFANVTRAHERSLTTLIQQHQDQIPTQLESAITQIHEHSDQLRTKLLQESEEMIQKIDQMVKSHWKRTLIVPIVATFLMALILWFSTHSAKMSRIGDLMQKKETLILIDGESYQPHRNDYGKAVFNGKGTLEYLRKYPNQKVILLN